MEVILLVTQYNYYALASNELHYIEYVQESYNLH